MFIYKGLEKTTGGINGVVEKIRGRSRRERIRNEKKREELGAYTRNGDRED